MGMKAIQVIFYVCILFVFMSCAHKTADIHSDIQFCENQKCAVLTEADSKESLFLKLTDMIKVNLNKKIPLLVSPEKGSKSDKDIVLEWMAGDRGDQKRLLRINSLTFTDILHIDRENREVKVMANVDYFQPDYWTGSMLGTHSEGSYTVQMPCSLTVRSPKEIVFQGKTKIWVYDLYFDALIDHIDTDRVFWGSAFTTVISGWGYIAKKEGYLHLAF